MVSEPGTQASGPLSAADIDQEPRFKADASEGANPQSSAALDCEQESVAAERVAHVKTLCGDPNAV